MLGGDLICTKYLSFLVLNVSIYVKDSDKYLFILQTPKIFLRSWSLIRFTFLLLKGGRYGAGINLWS